MYSPQQQSISTTASTSRSFGRLAARTTAGSGPRVIHAALTKVRAQHGAVDAMAFVDGWHEERREFLR